MRYKNKKEIKALIKQLLDDQEIHDILIDYDFELSKGLRPRHIKKINKVLQENEICFKLIDCKYSLPYSCDRNYKTPYFVTTESVIE